MFRGCSQTWIRQQLLYVQQFGPGGCPVSARHLRSNGHLRPKLLYVQQLFRLGHSECLQNRIWAELALQLLSHVRQFWPEPCLHARPKNRLHKWMLASARERGAGPKQIGWLIRLALLCLALLGLPSCVQIWFSFLLFPFFCGGCLIWTSAGRKPDFPAGSRIVQHRVTTV